MSINSWGYEMATELTFPAVSIGNGWKVTKAWITGSPIALVVLYAAAETKKSRLDLQKEMFIDPLPSELEPNKDSIHKVVAAITAATAAVRRAEAVR